MAYIGNSPSIATYKKLDSIAGEQDGIETNFSLTVNSVAYSPDSAVRLLVVKNGEVLDPGEDFSVAGSTLSFPEAPLSNDIIFIISLGEVAYTGVPSDGTVTNDKIATGTIAYDKLSSDTVGTIIGNIITYGI